MPVNCFPAGISITVSSALNTCIAQAIPLALLGILISLVVVFISYMVGNVIGVEGLRNWYRQDLWETVKSMILVASIFSVIVIIGGIALSITGSNGGSGLSALYASDMNYINNAYNVANITYEAFKWFSIGRGLITSSQFSYWGIAILPISFQHGFYRTSLLNSNILENFVGSGSVSFVGGTFTAVTFALIIFGAQQYLFVSLVLLGIGLFLPLGVIMRAFPIMRPLGALSIAIAIGLSIVYPTLLIAFNAPVYNYVSNTLALPATAADVLPAPPTLSCPYLSSIGPQLVNVYYFNNINTVGGRFNSFISSAINSICSFTVGTGGALASLISGITGTTIPNFAKVSFEYGMSSVFSLYPTFDFLFYYVMPDVLQMILLVIDVIITVIMINNISQWMGGRQFTASIGSLRLV